MKIEHCKMVDRVLAPICTVNGGIDSWRYFLASGLAFGYLDNRTEACESVLAKLKESLGSRPSSEVKFEDAEIFVVAGQAFQAIQSIDLPPIDLAEAIVNNALLLAKHYARGGFCSVDNSWTSFKIGLEHKYLADVNRLFVWDEQGNQIYKAELDSSKRPQVRASLDLGGRNKKHNL